MFFLLQPLIPTLSISEHIYGNGYRSYRVLELKIPLYFTLDIIYEL